MGHASPSADEVFVLALRALGFFKNDDVIDLWHHGLVYTSESGVLAWDVGVCFTFTPGCRGSPERNPAVFGTNKHLHLWPILNSQCASRSCFWNVRGKACKLPHRKAPGPAIEMLQHWAFNGWHLWFIDWLKYPCQYFPLKLLSRIGCSLRALLFLFFFNTAKQIFHQAKASMQQIQIHPIMLASPCFNWALRAYNECAIIQHKASPGSGINQLEVVAFELFQIQSRCGQHIISVEKNYKNASGLCWLSWNITKPIKFAGGECQIIKFHKLKSHKCMAPRSIGYSTQ